MEVSDVVTALGGIMDRVMSGRVPAGSVAAGSVTAGRPLAFVQPIPRHLVHRASVAEVYLTDAVAVAGEGDRFLVAAQWPRDHALYHPDGNGCADPLLFAETIRQTLVFLAHEHYGVPLGYRFVGRDMEFEISEPSVLKVGAVPLPVVLEVSWVWVDHRPPQRYGMRVEAVLTVGGVPCGRGSLRVVAVDEKRYGLLRRRGSRPAVPSPGAAVQPDLPERPVLPDRPGRGVVPERGERLPAHRVGRLRAKDSVLRTGGREGEWDLDVDLGHAILFDHPTDHVPLMVLLEGFRQLGYLQTSQGEGAVPHTLTGVSVTCLAFAELDVLVRLVMTGHRASARGGSPALLGAQAVQSGVLLSTVSMFWTADSSTPAAVSGAV
ncbi:ScbA/BarX family gamma-butyrolactone biosynthesis protein [Streptomyces sp. NPDC051987]|uniref:ScbA/BarX family gamma-butyrolactone biosynthesis protein n=1 Tax=Streptomyces sp. NPDC051987 TaxID=3155808 RepID=UPI003420B30C